MEETSIALPDVSKRQTDDPHFAKNLKGTASHVGFKKVEVHIFSNSVFLSPLFSSEFENKISTYNMHETIVKKLSKIFFLHQIFFY